MNTVTTQNEGLTAADLEHTPDDGKRYEIIDGRLYVTPAPRIRHQVVAFRLAVFLDLTCPAVLRVLMAPTDVVLAEATVVEPDILVARRSDLGETNLPAAPLLAVEVLSPGTRARDLSLKRSVYERYGVPSYWVVDPDRPSVTAWRLVDGRYAQIAYVEGEQVFAATEPYPVQVVPARLLD